EAFLAGPGNGDLFAFQVRNHNTMIGAVGDEQALGVSVGEDLAGEVDRLRVLLRLELEVDGRVLQLPLEVLEQLSDVYIKDVKVSLPGNRAIIVAVGIDEDERGPRADAVGVPDLVVGVVDDRVLEFIAEDRLVDA